MNTVKYQDMIKAITFAVLSLSSNEINAQNSDFNEVNLISPKKPSRPRQEWVDKRAREEAVKQPSTSSKDEQRKTYVKSHNKMARKYGSEHMIQEHAHHQGPKLLESAKSFHQHCLDLKEQTAESHRQLQALERTAENMGTAVAHTYGGGRVHDEEAKGAIAQLWIAVSHLREVFSNT